jgi:hypothetical protein
MSQSSPLDPSMLLLRAINTKLVSEKIAISLARNLIEEIYGKDELRAQEPLKALDGGETWIIEGNRKFGDIPTSDNLPDYGRQNWSSPSQIVRYLSSLGRLAWHR